MAYVRKDAPGSCPGHHWHRAGDVVEVDDPKLVADLLRLPGFSLAERPARRHESDQPDPQPEPEPEVEAVGEPERTEAITEPAPRPRRRPAHKD